MKPFDPRVELDPLDGRPSRGAIPPPPRTPSRTSPVLEQLTNPEERQGGPLPLPRVEYTTATVSHGERGVITHFTRVEDGILITQGGSRVFIPLDLVDWSLETMAGLQDAKTVVHKPFKDDRR